MGDDTELMAMNDINLSDNYRRTGSPVPPLTFDLLSGGHWSSQGKLDGTFTLLTIYRGMWCGHCKHQLSEFNRLQQAFKKRDVDVVAVSADTKERAQSTVKELSLSSLKIGFELPIEAARGFGVFVSKQVKAVEMPLFCEPASFLIKNDGTLFSAWIASNAFARTEPKDILDYIDFVSEKSDRPPRGSA